MKKQSVMIWFAGIFLFSVFGLTFKADASTLAKENIIGDYEARVIVEEYQAFGQINESNFDKSACF